MAAITFTSRPQGSRTASTDVLYASSGYAQGDEGRLIDAAEARVAEWWHGPSEYVTALTTGRPKFVPTPGLTGVVMLSLVSISSAACGSVWGYGYVLFPLAGVAGLAAYALLAKWVRQQSFRSPLLHFAERVRRSLAYEGDCGPKCR